MTLLLAELKEKLAEQFDEYTLLDMLQVNSFQLVQKFSDVIENNYEYFVNKVEDNGLDYGFMEEETTEEDC